MLKKEIYCRDEHETEVVAGAIATHASPISKITLSGDLGAGKTTFARGFLRALGYQGAVKSPTYTIVEPYEGLGRSGDIKLFHFDFYRIKEVEELELMGIRDYFEQNAIILIEWPEQSGDLLPQIDLVCYIEHHDVGRTFSFEASSDSGKIMLSALSGSTI